jgi:hypothetical protein
MRNTGPLTVPTLCCYIMNCVCMEHKPCTWGTPLECENRPAMIAGHVLKIVRVDCSEHLGVSQIGRVFELSLLKAVSSEHHPA